MDSYKINTLRYIEKKYEEIKMYKKQYIHKLKETTERGNQKVCLFGCGFLGKGFYYDFLDLGIKVECFCDNDPNKWGTNIVDDIKCISPEELKELYIKENVLVVLSLGKVDEVSKQLKNSNITNIIKHPFDLLADNQNNWVNITSKEILTKVDNLFDILEDENSKKVAQGLITAMFMNNDELNDFSYFDIYSNDIYVPEGVVELKVGESIVDGGSFNGDTLNYFLHQIGYKEFRRYYCFELNKNNVVKLREEIESLSGEISEKVIVYNQGMAEKSESIYYRDSTSSSYISKENQGIKGECVALDSVLIDEEITYIKMDIEGSEVSALKGAETIIKKNKPVCAISVYHKATDVWEIPLLLKKFVPDYNIYLRHHENIQAESLCYAVRN